MGPSADQLPVPVGGEGPVGGKRGCCLVGVFCLVGAGGVVAGMGGGRQRVRFICPAHWRTCELRPGTVGGQRGLRAGLGQGLVPPGGAPPSPSPAPPGAAGSPRPPGAAHLCPRLRAAGPDPRGAPGSAGGTAGLSGRGLQWAGHSPCPALLWAGRRAPEPAGRGQDCPAGEEALPASRPAGRCWAGGGARAPAGSGCAGHGASLCLGILHLR